MYVGHGQDCDILAMFANLVNITIHEYHIILACQMLIFLAVNHCTISKGLKMLAIDLVK